MEDLLGMVLAGIVDCTLDLLLEGTSAGLASGLSRLFRIFRVSVRRANPIVGIITFAAAGTCFGFVSVWIFPHYLIKPTKFHGIGLLVSPVLTGFLMSQIGRTVRNRGFQPVRIESFGYGFVFALAMSVVRLVLVR